MRKSIINWVGIIGSLSGIASLILYFATDVVWALVGCCIFCLSLIALVGFCIYKINGVLKSKNPDGYSRVATFIKYEVDSNKTQGIYETYRTIRCERPLMSEFEYNFQWKGSKNPKISSDLQNVGEPNYLGDKSRFDTVKLSFKRPLCFGDTATIHFKAEFDDIDGEAKPLVDAKVVSPINIIHYRIILSYKPEGFNKVACLKRKRIDAEVNCEFEDIRSIAYKPDSKSYEYHLIEPTVGYCYRIEWEK